jgi:hypothetical protein
MAQQPNLFPNPPESPGPRPPGSVASRARVQSSPGKQNPEISTRPISILARVEVIVRIIVRLYLGLLILVLPWLPFWMQNNLFTYSPFLLTLAGSGFFRGVVSGLGLLGVILAVVEAKNAPELS